MAMLSHEAGVNVPRAGDWYHDQGVWVEVGTVDPGGGWAMIHCTIPPGPRGSRIGPGWAWDKEQPLIGGTFPAGWTRADPPPEDERAGWVPVRAPVGAWRPRPCGTSGAHD
jgi:hypothetical protein